LEGSLSRLQTDYIDLYQLHWPERETTKFGTLNYVHQPEYDGIALEESFSALLELKIEGKIRSFGVSNETPWGLMTYLKIAEKYNCNSLVSIQNPYSLLNRIFEIALAEVVQRENIAMLAYSPLGFGVLSGKYLKGGNSQNSRLRKFKKFNRYSNQQAVKATQAYVKLANEYELEPAQMALAYLKSKDFITSTIIGATSLAQLKQNIDSFKLRLSEEILEKIEKIHIQYPNPCP
jgi:aryl-alcohol dehydrogenase-like predicted oxidoreductase